ncbi:TetR family transcriptional regulator [Pyxidicoccus fallax]|uniref:TetR family transcriptional regulator n=3 Tax=Pyxidicoccus fallax TaxID=394095 RepID=A0A848LT26_9BACT|nr:TetR family transcriptional regulator [Pyxidicoccus fallax]
MGMWWGPEHLYEVALRESATALAERGYGHVRAEELARAGGMSVGSFYRRHGSKAGFAQEVRQWAEGDVCRIARGGFEMVLERPEGSFREAFDVFWEELAWCATRKPELFHFTFMHWHPDSLEPEALGNQARELVREVLAHGERVGALAPGSVRVGEGLIWGALAELVRAVARGDEQDALENVKPMGRVLWKALAAEENRGAGSGRTPPSERDGTEGTDAEGAGTPSLEEAATEGSATDEPGASIPLEEEAATEGSVPGGPGASPPGAATLEAPGTEDSGASSVGTPLSGLGLGEASTARDSGTAALEATGAGHALQRESVLAPLAACAAPVRASPGGALLRAGPYGVLDESGVMLRNATFTPLLQPSIQDVTRQAPTRLS